VITKRKLLDATSSRLEHSHQQSISYLAQETRFQVSSYFGRKTSHHKCKPLTEAPEMYGKQTALPTSGSFLFVICEQSGFLHPNDAAGASVIGSVIRKLLRQIHSIF
jgi:hypothetical protein